MWDLDDPTQSHYCRGGLFCAFDDRECTGRRAVVATGASNPTHILFLFFSFPLSLVPQEARSAGRKRESGHLYGGGAPDRGVRATDDGKDVHQPVRFFRIFCMIWLGEGTRGIMARFGIQIKPATLGKLCKKVFPEWNRWKHSCRIVRSACVFTRWLLSAFRVFSSEYRVTRGLETVAIDQNEKCVNGSFLSTAFHNPNYK